MYANVSSWKYSLSKVTSFSFANSMFSPYLLRVEGTSENPDAKKWMTRKWSLSDWQLQASWKEHIPVSIINDLLTHTLPFCECDTVDPLFPCLSA